jgi:hypothetical protein
VAALVVVGLCYPCGANSFDLQFSSGNLVWGNGVVTATELSPGVFLATGGSFQLTAGPYAGFSGNLVPTAGQGLWCGGGPRDFEFTAYGGTDIGFDDLIVQSSPTTFALTDWGLLFNDTQFSRPGGSGLVFNPWLNAPGDSGYLGPGDYVAGFNGYNNQPWFDQYHGTMTITDCPVPDGGATALLLGIGLVALGAMRAFAWR